MSVRTVRFSAEASTRSRLAECPARARRETRSACREVVAGAGLAQGVHTPNRSARGVHAPNGSQALTLAEVSLATGDTSRLHEVAALCWPPSSPRSVDRSALNRRSLTGRPHPRRRTSPACGQNVPAGTHFRFVDQVQRSRTAHAPGDGVVRDAVAQAEGRSRPAHARRPPVRRTPTPRRPG